MHSLTENKSTDNMYVFLPGKDMAEAIVVYHTNKARFNVF